MANKKPGAERSGRAHVASFNFRNYADLGEVVKCGRLGRCSSGCARIARSIPTRCQWPRTLLLGTCAFAFARAVPECGHAAH
jgi:hypothetical protein